MKTYRVVKRKPRLTPAFGKGVRVVIHETGWDQKPWPIVGEIVMAAHPPQWFVCPDGTNMLLRFDEADLETIPF